MNSRLPCFVCALTLVLFVASVFYFGAALPERVASHFNAEGLADGWMSRTSHLKLFTAVGVSLSVFVVGICYLIRFFPPSSLNVPHADYWRSPEHFPEACDYLFWNSFWLSTVLLVWMGGIHYFLVQANLATPPTLDTRALAFLSAVLIGGLILWVITLVRYFWKVPKAS